MILRPFLNKYFLSFFIIIVFIASFEVFTQTKRALIVGIDKYEPRETSNQKSLRRKWSNLDGAVNDALAVKEVLIAQFGFSEDNIYLLLDSLNSSGFQASRENIISSIEEKLINQSKKGDIIFFYYAGHGSQIKNSKSPEEDKMDETIVPSDSYLSQENDIRDIRDKELALLFNQLVDKGVILTLVFDSCHSGSIARGREDDYIVRKLEPIEIDVADSEVYPKPEDRERGALVISAAQDYQTAKETKDDYGQPHGAFTSAFLKTLRSYSTSESVISLYSSIKAIVESTGRDQFPVLAGPEKRKKQNLFGIDSDQLENKTVVAVLNISDEEIILQGGIAVGLREGTELKKINGSENELEIQVKVIGERGLNKSVIEIIKGKRDEINPGDLFEVTKWAVPDNVTLNLYLPETNLTFNELINFVEKIYQVSIENGISLSDEPNNSNTNYELFYSDLKWKLKNLVNGKIEDVGENVDFSTFKNLFSQDKPVLFVNLPPSIEMSEEVKSKFTSVNGIIKLTGQKEAKYFLSGRYKNDKLEYAFYLPEITSDQKEVSSLPVVSDWDEISSANLKNDLNKIFETSFKLAKINAWLTLEVPEDGGSFPYRLALRNSMNGKLITEGNVIDGEIYGFALVLDSLLLKNWDKTKRWIYVLGIDSYGEVSLFYPTNGNVENREPEVINPLPTEIILGNKKLFKIGKPFGTDTYILLTSPDQIPNPELMESKGVKTRSATQGNPLVDLFSNIGSTTRAGNKIMPTEWSLNRITTISIERKAD